MRRLRIPVLACIDASRVSRKCHPAKLALETNKDTVMLCFANRIRLNRPPLTFRQLGFQVLDAIEGASVESAAEYPYTVFQPILQVVNHRRASHSAKHRFASLVKQLAGK
jgi:hypothetical protein